MAAARHTVLLAASNCQPAGTLTNTRMPRCPLTHLHDHDLAPRRAQPRLHRGDDGALQRNLGLGADVCLFSCVCKVS